MAVSSVRVFDAQLDNRNTNGTSAHAIVRELQERIFMRTLYTVPTANGFRASIALEECGISYDTRHVDLLQGEHRSDEMLKLNPFGRMPILKDDDSVVYGSLAIAMWAANQSGKLLPAASEQDAFYHWIGVVMTDLAPTFASHFFLAQLAPEPDEWGVNFHAAILRRFLTGIDRHLADSQYFLSDYSVVDVLMFPSATASAARLSEGLEPYPDLARWAEHLGQRDAVQRGMAASTP